MNHRMFDGKVALVTGAASGIGRATAIAFASGGAQVVVADHNEECGQSAVRTIREQGGTAIFLRADMLSQSDIAAMVRECIRAFGGLDFAFNNAGIEGEQAATADYSADAGIG